jgi:hypothetical protein
VGWGPEEGGGLGPGMGVLTVPVVGEGQVMGGVGWRVLGRSGWGGPWVERGVL